MLESVAKDGKEDTMNTPDSADDIKKSPQASGGIGSFRGKPINPSMTKKKLLEIISRIARQKTKNTPKEVLLAASEVPVKTDSNSIADSTADSSAIENNHADSIALDTVLDEILEQFDPYDNSHNDFVRRKPEAKAKLKQLIDKRERLAEDKALEYAAKLFDLTKQWPDYYLRHLNGEKYRKDHKNVKVTFRQLSTQSVKGDE